MPKKYTPAIFQATVRPSWAGILSYISEKERSDILEAIIKYPNKDIDSKFWQETIKPDLDEQYDKFLKICDIRGRSAKTYWGEHKLSISNTNDIHKDNLLKDKGKDKDKVKVNINNIIKPLNSFSNNKILVDDKLNLLEIDDPDIPLYKDEFGYKIILDVQNWLVKAKKGQMVEKEYIIRQFKNFAYRQGAEK